MMKKTALGIIVLTVFSLLILTFQGKASIRFVNNEKFKLDFYGFLKFDGTYQDNPMNSLIACRYAKFGEEGNTNLTAMNSRFGLRWTDLSLVKRWAVKGHFEWDLYDGTSRNQMKFRIRHAYFSLSNRNSSFLFGQYWDVFSPLGPTTLLTNGYFWQTGNLGFRRAQIRYTWSSDMFDFAASLNDPTSSGATKTCLPITQGRIGMKFGNNGNIKIGLSTTFGRDHYTNSLEDYETDVDIAGLSLDWIVPFARNLTLKGESGQGQNLSVFLSRSNVYDNVKADKFEGKKATAFWSEIVYSLNNFQSWLGYAFEDLTDKSQLISGNLKKTRAIFSGLKYNVISSVSLGIEYCNFLSQYLNLDDEAKTNQLVISAIYTF